MKGRQPNCLQPEVAVSTKFIFSSHRFYVISSAPFRVIKSTTSNPQIRDAGISKTQLDVNGDGRQPRTSAWYVFIHGETGLIKRTTTWAARNIWACTHSNAQFCGFYVSRSGASHHARCALQLDRHTCRPHWLGRL